SIKTRCITAHMNNVYAKKTVVSNVYDDWTQTIDTFTTNAKRKGISDKHIRMLTDTIDSNSQSIISHLRGDQNQPNSLSNDRIGIALELVQERIVSLFLDEVKAPYATIRVNGHVETIPIQSQRFGDWVGALFYNHNREQGRSLVLSEQGIGQIQRVLR